MYSLLFMEKLLCLLIPSLLIIPYIKDGEKYAYKWLQNYLPHRWRRN